MDEKLTYKINVLFYFCLFFIALVAPSTYLYSIEKINYYNIYDRERGFFYYFLVLLIPYFAYKTYKQFEKVKYFKEYKESPDTPEYQKTMLKRDHEQSRSELKRTLSFWSLSTVYVLSCFFGILLKNNVPVEYINALFSITPFILINLISVYVLTIKRLKNNRINKKSFLKLLIFLLSLQSIIYIIYPYLNDGIYSSLQNGNFVNIEIMLLFNILFSTGITIVFYNAFTKVSLINQNEMLFTFNLQEVKDNILHYTSTRTDSKNIESASDINSMDCVEDNLDIKEEITLEEENNILFRKFNKLLLLYTSSITLIISIVYHYSHENIYFYNVFDRDFGIIFVFLLGLMIYSFVFSLSKLDDRLPRNTQDLLSHKLITMISFVSFYYLLICLLAIGHKDDPVPIERLTLFIIFNIFVLFNNLFIMDTVKRRILQGESITECDFVSKGIILSIVYAIIYIAYRVHVNNYFFVIDEALIIKESINTIAVITLLLIFANGFYKGCVFLNNEDRNYPLSYVLIYSFNMMIINIFVYSYRVISHLRLLAVFFKR